MLVLIILLVVAALSLYFFTWLNRRNKTENTEITVAEDGECCGAHSVCERDSLLSSSDKIEYFDDEELDKLSCIPADKFSPEQVSLISDVFYTLKEHEVATWLRSLQLRRIELPVELRDAAFLIIGERRQVGV